MPTHDDADQLYKQAVEAAGRGDYPQATTLFEHALTLYQTLPNTQRDQAKCLFYLANTLSKLDKLAQAESHYRQALTLYQDIPNTEEHQATCLYNLATILATRGKLADAEPYYHQALTLYQDIPCQVPGFV